MKYLDAVVHQGSPIGLVYCKKRRKEKGLNVIFFLELYVGVFGGRVKGLMEMRGRAVAL